MNSSNDVKRINRSAILKSIYKSGAISKSRLAAELGMTVMTVNNLVGELCEQGICAECGYASSGGRRAGLYRINPEYGYIIGLSIKRTELVLGIYDLALALVMEKRCTCDIEDPDVTLPKIYEMLYDGISSQSHKCILGIGIAVPGRVDIEGTVIDLPDFPNWRGVQLEKLLSERLSLPIFVDNDTNALLLSAKWHGIYCDGETVAYINADGGLGAAFMNRDELFYGSNNRAMELGHITLSPDGPLCRCGRRGCLEAYLAACENDADNDSYADLERETDYIFTAIRNVALLFDPEMIILQNERISLHTELYEKLKEKLGEDRYTSNITLHISSDKKIIGAAAACIVVQNVFC